MKDAYALWDMNQPTLYQTSPALASMPIIRPNGCYALSLFQVMANVFRLPVSYALALSFFKRELADIDEDVDNEMTVRDAQNFVDDLVGPGRVQYIHRHIPPNEPCPLDVFQFGCWHKTGKSYFHFTFCNGKNITLIDPWSAEGSDSVRDGFMVSWRGFKIL